MIAFESVISSTWAIVALVGVVGCDDNEGQSYAAIDRGTVCFRSQIGATNSQNFFADEPIFVHLEYAACVSSSCSRDSSATCSLTLDGPSLHVETLVSWTDVSGIPGRKCTADCAYFNGTCEVTLPEGSYTIIYGTRTLPLSVPGFVPGTPCIENP